MFLKPIVFAFLIAVGTLISCSVKSEFPTRYKGEQIHFGQGGGFSGILSYYVLLDDGRLFQRAIRDTSFALSNTWDRAFARQMFSNYESLDLRDVDFFEPGDKYFFIQHKSGNEPFHTITWGRPGTTPNEKVVTFYNILYKSTKSTL